ncbi:SMI1/KNR4 family protein [Hymenobacter sp. H14-R3]|uniref:SMI1/KNR4 family protein n=1 Tax=Hymenobacter sp. H14-R3 TaxID=3046308 RepID=UPI0024B95BF3|nr:SMI1/KNR4 family protein [Hymenobacter sp. H14-R3]MDJ0363668.1 SMI1/KNR4 family protein [Hymenobacter sp. H14-R3]
MNVTAWGTTTEPEIVAFEEEIGFELPADYRQFLLETNGAEVNKQVFFVRDLTQDVLMNVFFGLTNLASRSLTLRYWLQEYEDEIEEQTLLIGSDPGGHFILYTVSGEDQGIYYWDHNNFLSPGAAKGAPNTFRVAASFTEFCGLLTDYEWEPLVAPVAEQLQQNEQALQDLTQQLGQALPPDYQAFLRQADCTVFDKQLFSTKQLAKPLKIRYLFGINQPERTKNASFWLREFQEDLEPTTLVIGKDTSNGLLLYFMAGEDQGIYFWDCNQQFPESSAEEGDTYFLADSFADFCAGLTGAVA